MALLDTVGLVLGGLLVLAGVGFGLYYGGRWLLTSTFRRSRGRRAKRLVGLAAIVLFVAAVVGLIAVLVNGVSTKTSAYPILNLVGTVYSSPWTYVIVGALLLRKVIVFRRGRYAKQAAAQTGMDTRSIKHLAAEARSPDGTARVVATADDTLTDIERRIDETLRTGEDDTLTPAADPGEVWNDIYAAEREAQSLVTRLENSAWSHVLDDELTEHRPLQPGTGDHETDPDPKPTTDDVGFWTELKHYRLDLASAINFSNILWQFLLPALVTATIVLSLLGVWVGLAWYPVVALLGLFVGAVNYYRHRRKEARRLDSLRDDAEGRDWSMVAALVKEVETQETTAYYGWLAGRRYASYDRDRFVSDLAKRTHEKVDRGYAAPSIMEKNAEQLADYYPDLAGFRDQERHDIQLELIDRVRESQYGLVPKQQLIEDTVEHRMEERAGGIYREGMGYDPGLVRVAYDDLVPGALTEVEVTVDTENGPQTLIAVESTLDPMPVDRAQVRAEFSALFREYATREPRYELPPSPKIQMPPHPLETRDADQMAVGVTESPVRADGGDEGE
ncbi:MULTISPECIES: hypothetical protein [Salinibaculum]|uniref:hypothetical protein n=1 Tax=Salinibaculum TaxID=2732368 RepID=UPI0030D11D14